MMCTQKEFVSNKERSQTLFTHREGLCSDNTNKRSYCYFKTCFNSGMHLRDVQVRCLLRHQSLPSSRCRHLVCFILAYLAVSTSAEVTEHQLLSNVTVLQHLPDSNKTSNIPLQVNQGMTNTEHLNTRNSTKPSSQTLQQGDTKLSKKQRTMKVLKKHETVIPSVNSVDNKVAASKSLLFIENIFQRYGNKNYILQSEVNKLFVNLGLSHALNKSDIGHVNLTEVGYENLCQELNQHTETGDMAVNETDKHFYGVDVLRNDSTSENMQQMPSNSSHSDLAVPASLGPKQKCLSKDELFSMFKFDQSKQLHVDEFRYLCPALIDQLDAGYCRKCLKTNSEPDKNQGMGDHNHHHDEGDEHHNHHHDEGEDHHNHPNGEGDDHHNHHHDEGEDRHNHDKGHEGTYNHKHINSINVSENLQEKHNVEAAVWLYAILSVAVISLCSIAGVVVIPNIKRVFYNHILQFLVALAVGAMSGDTMLHLFPHAMLSESHEYSHHHHEPADVNTTESHDETHSHKKSTHLAGLYKGLVALLGIYSFFFLERLFTLFTRSRSGRKKKQKSRRRCHEQHQERNQDFHMVNSKLENDGGNTPSCDEMVMVVHPNKALRAYADVSHEAYLHRCDESMVQQPSGYSVTTVLSNKDEHMMGDASICRDNASNTGLAAWNVPQMPSPSLDAEIVGITKDTELTSHSHSHLAPDFVGSISPVAMMVIVGDMIHNFCDGLAIGAAYASNVTGGLSTSVAVFCHELPHEIGDFAVLVRSGLTMRKAVYFNLISSIPCLIGAIIGLVVGNAISTSTWIFAAVGGMFLYVTLVDLIPEMSSVYTKCDEPWFLHLLLQASGIAVGTTIMLIISVYEETLLTAFNKN